MKVKKLNPDAILPTRAYSYDAGYDLYSIEDCVIHPRNIRTIETGLAVEIPNGWVGFIKNRSSLGLKGLDKTSQVIDSGYRNSIKVVLANVSDDVLFLEKGAKIAQLVICPCLQEDIEVVDELSETDRGLKGWGSSGN